jgi:inorganic pyrophosphatase
MRVFVENPAGLAIKHHHAEKSLEFLGTTAVSRAYPYPYGFVLGTTSEDGDNVDCFIVTSTRLSRGDIVECHSIGLMEQLEDGLVDHNVLAALSGEQAFVDDKTQDHSTRRWRTTRARLLRATVTDLAFRVALARSATPW